MIGFVDSQIMLVDLVRKCFLSRMFFQRKEQTANRENRDDRPQGTDLEGTAVILNRTPRPWSLANRSKCQLPMMHWCLAVAARFSTWQGSWLHVSQSLPQSSSGGEKTLCLLLERLQRQTVSKWDFQSVAWVLGEFAISYRVLRTKWHHEVAVVPLSGNILW